MKIVGAISFGRFPLDRLTRRSRDSASLDVRHLSATWLPNPALPCTPIRANLLVFLVLQHVAKVDVEGSNPFSRSIVR